MDSQCWFHIQQSCYIWPICLLSILDFPGIYIVISFVNGTLISSFVLQPKSSQVICPSSISYVFVLVYKCLYFLSKFLGSDDIGRKIHKSSFYKLMNCHKENTSMWPPLTSRKRQFPAYQKPPPYLLAVLNLSIFPKVTSILFYNTVAWFRLFCKLYVCANLEYFIVFKD